MPTAKTRNIPQNISVGDMTFEAVKQFKYLGAIIDYNCDMSVTVKDRIHLGNRGYFVNVKLLSSRLITRTKLNIYHTLVRPVTTNGSEAWTLTKGEEDLLRCFERKILRRIYGPVYENNEWQIRYNEEINQLKVHNRRKGRPKKRWLDGVIRDLEIMGVRDWRKKTEDKAEWRTVVPPRVVVPDDDDDNYFL
ncbi:hypothetical protein ANN_00031 [Periplaneta americana]|uniref:Uncharacterized protein n=1 Tax=Periplaneta americana TaxID=6978 RepID=A0ABQ8TR90_PERAM|nr:hypothetical protein ANN_00031 [Periplaneta americana]